MEEYIESELWLFEAEDLMEYDKVAGARYRKKFGQALDNSGNNSIENRHL